MAQSADIKMLLLRVVLIMIVLKSISSSLHVTECDPDKKCEKAQLGNKISNPFDCHSYFICVGSSKGTRKASDVSIKCPNNQTFSSNKYRNICMSHQKCENSCINICNGECTNYHYERIADVKDCSGFYTCSPDKVKVKTKCPLEAPYFDGVNCQKSKFACCSCCDECTAYCHKTYTQIADPYDCRSFYLCEKLGFPEQKNQHQCPQGKYFDRKREKCEDEDNLTPCTPTCKNETNSE